MLNTIAGNDPKDSTSLSVDATDYTAALEAGERGLKGLRIGVPTEYFVEGMDPEVEASTRRSIALLEELGAEVAETSLPHTSFALAVYYILAPSECSANLARYDGVKYGFSDREAESMWEALERTRSGGFGPEVKRRIMLGTYALSSGYYDAFYLKAQKVRTIIRREFERAFEEFDAIVSATSPTVAFRLGEKTADPVQMYLSDVLTLPANIAGLPGISVPAGLSEDGLPIGFQILAGPLRRGDDLQNRPRIRAVVGLERPEARSVGRGHSWSSSLGGRLRMSKMSLYAGSIAPGVASGGCKASSIDWLAHLTLMMAGYALLNSSRRAPERAFEGVSATSIVNVGVVSVE